MGLMAIQTFQKNRFVNSKDIAIETTQNKTQKEKRILRNEKNNTELCAVETVQESLRENNIEVDDIKCAKPNERSEVYTI